MFLLAANGAPIDPHDKWLWGVLAIMAIFALGLAMILLLTIAWRRYNQRIDGQPREPREDTDIWREAAGRWRDEEQDQDDDDPDQRQLDR